MEALVSPFLNRCGAEGSAHRPAFDAFFQATELPGAAGAAAKWTTGQRVPAALSWRLSVASCLGIVSGKQNSTGESYRAGDVWGIEAAIIRQER